VSDLPNALTDTVRKYGIGIVCGADSEEALGRGLGLFAEEEIVPDWDGCLGEMSWERQVGKVIEEVGKEFKMQNSNIKSSLRQAQGKRFQA